MTQLQTAPIQWQAPEPRTGLAGLMDKFIGPGATRAELILQFLFPLLAAAAAAVYAHQSGATWSALHYTVAVILALDMVGGVITNATAAAKRWYHRQGQDMNHHMQFVSAHFLHLVVVAWLFVDGGLLWGIISGVYLLAAAGAILTVPLYLQRPVALTTYAGALLLSIYFLQQPLGLEWFLPLFFLKLLVSHLPKEAPFQSPQQA